MSDLISTPSQPQSAVSNDAFEVLIDLLTSDGIDESLPANQTRSQANMSLRDPSGRLDYDKIRVMFASQKPSGYETRSVQSPSVEGDSDDEHHSNQTTSRSASMSPRPVEQAAAGHRRSSTFGNPPWMAIHRNGTETKGAPPNQPLSLDELNTALAGAHEEVRSLRQQYDELQALVSKRSVSEKAKPSPSTVNTDMVAPVKGNGRVETRDMASQAEIGSLAPLPSNVPTVIADLAENEARRALNALACSLSLSPSAIIQMANLATPVASMSPKSSLSPPGSTRQHDVASIVRALKFLGTVDELVWRRTSGSSGPRTLLPAFSEENIVALVARLELWERAVRRPSRY